MRCAAVGKAVPDWDERMATDRFDDKVDGAELPASSGERVDTASQQYRKRLQEKAAKMRAAVLAGETDDEHVLAVAEALERLAADGE